MTKEIANVFWLKDYRTYCGVFTEKEKHEFENEIYVFLQIACYSSGFFNVLSNGGEHHFNFNKLNGLIYKSFIDELVALSKKNKPNSLKFYDVIDDLMPIFLSCVEQEYNSVKHQYFNMDFEFLSSGKWLKG